MRRYKRGIDRGQVDIFPARLDDYVNANNPVRAIDAYIESLNLRELGYIQTQAKQSAAGQPAYAPGTLLKLYLYGYLNRVRSSRQLERECQRNLEVVWLLQGLKPSYKTIADFRKVHGQALRQTHRDFILLCKHLGLFGGERVAVDGSYFKGSVSQKSFRTRARLTREIEQLQRQIDGWLTELDQRDHQECDVPEVQSDLAGKLEQLKALQAHKATKQRQRSTLEQADKDQHSDVDPDARLLSKAGQKVAGYNVQIVTDTRHKLLVTDEVTNQGNDLRQLYPMSQQAKTVLGVPALEVLADAGYYHSAQINACIEAQITPYVTEPDKEADRRRKGKLLRADFVYLPQADAYRCPGQHLLRPSGLPRLQNGYYHQRYNSSATDCRCCSLRARCLSRKATCRELWRSEHEQVMQDHHHRMLANPQIMRQRSAAVEHPFGTLKRRAGWDHFLVRGLAKVRGEWSLMALAYNFTRVLNLLGLDGFRKACAQRMRQAVAEPPCDYDAVRIVILAIGQLVGIRAVQRSLIHIAARMSTFHRPYRHFAFG
jgi:transposase